MLNRFISTKVLYNKLFKLLTSLLFELVNSFLNTFDKWMLLDIKNTTSVMSGNVESLHNRKQIDGENKLVKKLSRETYI